MSKQRWEVRFSPVALKDKYKIPRGEAALFRDAVAVLYAGPTPAGVEGVAGEPNTFQYVRNGYVIAFEVLEAERTNRIVYFDRVETAD